MRIIANSKGLFIDQPGSPRNYRASQGKVSQPPDKVGALNEVPLTVTVPVGADEVLVMTRFNTIE